MEPPGLSFSGELTRGSGSLFVIAGSPSPESKRDPAEI